MAPAKTQPRAPPTRTQRRRPRGGTHDDNPSQAPPDHTQPPRRTGSNKVRANNTKAAATQPPTKATLTHRRRGGEDNAEPTKQAMHGPGQNTTSPNPTMPAGRRPRQRQLKPSTTWLRRRHTNTMCRAHPDHSTAKHTPDGPLFTRHKQERLNATGCALAGLLTAQLTRHTVSTRRQTTTGNVTRRVVQRPTRAQPTNTETGMTTSGTTSDRASDRCSAKTPTPNKPTMRWPGQSCTNKPAAAATT